MKTCRAFLDGSAEKRSGHAVIDSTGFDRDQSSRHYARRARSHLLDPVTPRHRCWDGRSTTLGGYTNRDRHAKGGSLPLPNRGSRRRPVTQSVCRTN